MSPPEPWQADFVRKHHGKLVCFHCGEFVAEEYRGKADCVTGGTVTERLRELGRI
jgi:hypothetical protein